MRPLVLASTSRYRAQLLDRLGLPYQVDAPAVDETTLPGEAPATACVRLAEAKARAVAARHPGALVLGSDQIADCDGEHVGKPGTLERARAQLAALSGRTVVFHTGVALVDAASGRSETGRVDVRSTLRRLTAAEIDAYLAREAPFDCAGSVKSEGLGIALFESIESDDPTALVGLPLIATCRLLRRAGIDVLAAGR
ncbi:7-methyl-GTP pyrophosphatase [Burkholderiales bacterium]|nr:7-methyl-GTP pyrophosphatase [Burkholderiales bacterium]